MWIVLQRCVLAEEKAKNENKFSQALLDAIPFGMDIVDEHGTILFANNALRRMMGPDIVGKKCWQAYSDDKTQCTRCPRKKPIRIGETKSIESDGILNGKCMKITHTGMMYGGRKAILEIFEDITERKRAEKEIRKTVETREGFISMVSHELRTPLTAIKESMEIILEGIAGKVSAKQKQFLEIGSRNVDRLARLINDVLDLQKLEAGQEHFKIEDNDLRRAAQEVLAAMKPLAESRGLALALHWTDDIPRIRFDRDKIIQVLTNLLNNSLKFTEQGAVTVKLARIDSVVRISVEDTGPGIAKEDIPKLFQSFAQVGKAKEMTGGTGLGLVICKRIVAHHGGRIWAESKLGEGTSVRFTLPVNGREERS